MVVNSMGEQMASLIGEDVPCGFDSRTQGLALESVAERLARKRQRPPSVSTEFKQPSPVPEDTRLYESKAIDYESLPIPVKDDQKASLSTKDVIRRRLAMLTSLREIYQEEYWRLLEEMRHQHRQGTWREIDLNGTVSPRSHPQEGDIGQHQDDGKELSESGRKSDRSFKRKREHKEQNGSPSPDLEEEEQSLKQQIRAHKRQGHDDESQGNDVIPSFSDAEMFMIDEGGRSSGAVNWTKLKSWKEDQRDNFRSVERLEQAASAMTGRELDDLGALACFCGRNKRLLVKQISTCLGRSTDAMQVDIDLGAEGDTKKISRLQATLSLDLDGKFKLTCAGKRFMRVNHQQMNQGETLEVPHLSLLEVGGVRVLFMINHAAVERIISRTAQIHL